MPLPSRLLSAALVAAALGASGSGCARPALVYLSGEPPLYDAAAPVGFRVMSFNIARGAGAVAFAVGVPHANFRHNLAQIAALLRREQPDVVGLQEVDTKSPWTSDFDTVIYMARRSGYWNDYLGLHTLINWFGLASPKMWGGAALMSHLRLSNIDSVRFDTGWIDVQGFVVATVHPPALGGRAVDVVSLHLNPESAARRREQVQIVARHLAHRGRPLVVLGDFNELGDDPAGQLAARLHLRRYRPAAHLPTFPSDAPTVRVDWILVSRDLDFAAYHTLPEQLSDHRPVMAIVVPAAAR